MADPEEPRRKCISPSHRNQCGFYAFFGVTVPLTGAVHPRGPEWPCESLAEAWATAETPAVVQLPLKSVRVFNEAQRVRGRPDKPRLTILTWNNPPIRFGSPH